MSDQERSEIENSNVDRPTRDDPQRPGPVNRADLLPDSLIDGTVVQKIDRYIIESKLGQGGFGIVFLATDPRLNRKVAIKLPRVDRVVDEIVWKQFIDEGRAVANLKHDSIIQVYDINRQVNGIPYVVMEYVEGETLSDLYKRKKPLLMDAVTIIRQIAEGLKFAHKRNIVHRDLKPANIMVDILGQAKIADFGLALHDDTPIRKISQARAGTAKFMSPEQLRGENHKLDGRTDLWALGVVIYWMFTGRYPFSGETIHELADEICGRDPKPIRQLNELIPIEIERICLRCLSRLMHDRYQSASELIEDIDYFIQKSSLKNISHDGKQEIHEDSGKRLPENQPSDHLISGSKSDHSVSNSQSKVTVVPRGLRSFDAGDVEFFLSLLPGPTDRFGVPDSLRFWLQLYSDRNSDLPIGLLYGPSGCGKSSFVRAGLLPRLPEEFLSIRVECSATDTEQDILRKVARCVGTLGSTTLNELSLLELLHRIRNGLEMGRGRRLLIVLDQFEQWLNANELEGTAELVEALRQCDGDRVQCLLLVRDDFWMATHQFMRLLETKIQEGKNSQALPLFDQRHARKVLIGFGQAYGTLPGGETKLQKHQTAFIRKAIESLSNNGKVICAHLSLFAEMMKSREWTAAEFARVGGWQGIGVQYLEESFGEKYGSPNHKQQLPYVRAVLGKLIPESGASIKISSCSRSELSKLMDGSLSEATLDEVLETLDTDMRLVTQTFHEAPATSTNSSIERSEPRYQLAHDVLVEPIGQWLTRKDRESWQGRATIRLEELTTLWAQKKEKRLLPSLFEFLTLQTGTAPKKRNGLQRQFLSDANVYYGIRIAIALAAFVLATTSIVLFRNNVIERQTALAIQSALDARADALPLQLNALKSNPNLVRRLLGTLKLTDPRQMVRFELIKSHFFPSTEIDELVKTLAVVETNECQNYVDALREIKIHNPALDIGKQLSRLSGESTDVKTKIRMAILGMHFSNDDWKHYCLENVEDPTNRTRFTHELPKWHGNLDELVELIQPEVDPKIDMVFCRAFVLLADSGTRQIERSKIQGWLEDRFRHSTNAGVHFAAELALKNWRFEIPVCDSPLGAKWIRRKVSTDEIEEIINFVRIPAGLAPLESGIDEDFPARFENSDAVCPVPFLISTTEVGAKLFFQFVDDPTTESLIKERYVAHPLRNYMNEDFPIYSVTWNDAVQFCNWLNQFFDKLEPAYEFIDGRWQTVDGDGFRLPTIAEWELACRAESKTAFFFGNKDVVEFLPFYGWCSSCTLPHYDLDVGPRGDKLPNDFGVFDIIGNASEWNHNRFADIPGAPLMYAIRGGNTWDSIRSFYSGQYMNTPPTRGIEKNGIRLVFPIANSPDQ